jgi:hypothetical protein
MSTINVGWSQPLNLIACWFKHYSELQSHHCQPARAHCNNGNDGSPIKSIPTHHPPEPSGAVSRWWMETGSMLAIGVGWCWSAEWQATFTSPHKKDPDPDLYGTSTAYLDTKYYDKHRFCDADKLFSIKSDWVRSTWICKPQTAEIHHWFWPKFCWKPTLHGTKVT